MKRSLINITDLSVEEIDGLIAVAEDIVKSPEKYRESCRYKKLSTLFFEPSTRTRLSFEAAMYELGGNVLGFSEAQSSSVSKGETVNDTIKMVSGYADIIAMRHSKDGAAAVGAEAADVPLINAGDGTHFHPTQTLADLLTIKRELARLDGLTIGICGDLRYGRTVHSLICALSRYPNNKFVLISPKELTVPDYTENLLKRLNVRYEETDNLAAAIPSLDVLYMTRVQRERFSDICEYERLKDSYILTPEKLTAAKKTMRILHPLPRVNEISTEIDVDERAAYFRQAVNGKYMRMALILFLLKDKTESTAPKRVFSEEIACKNPVCITRCDRNVKNYTYFDENGKERCYYCDRIIVDTNK